MIKWQDILRVALKKSLTERLAESKKIRKDNPYITLPSYSNISKEEIDSFFVEMPKLDKR